MNMKLFLPCLLSAVCISSVANSQNVGIGTQNPGRAKLEVHGVAGTGSTTALFGGSSTGISLQQNWPTIGFNQYRDNPAGNGKYIANGYAAIQYFDPASGSMYMDLFNTGIASTQTSAPSRAMFLNFGLTNTSFGVGALQTGMGANHTAFGKAALANTQNSGFNTAIGAYALLNTATGSRNVAIGNYSQSNNNSGADNTSIGYLSLQNTTASANNTAIGSRAGDDFNNGFNNIFVGANADVNAANLFNVVAIGEGVVVSASSTARFGNLATTSYGGWANWTNVSDGRFKKGVEENVPGLSFITRLRPVSYYLQAQALDDFLRRNKKDSLDNETTAFRLQALTAKEQVRYTGFIAQEVEAAAKALGFEFSGVDAPKNENDTYGLRYAEFVVPLVKAIQEQQAQIAQKEERIQQLELAVEEMKKQQKELHLLKTQMAELLKQKQ
ncbi:MAG TPA: tail fiber domain-containing protein [Flavisolibacter sp.]|nr:tail fiber domain-containing protein [Flavisolibacter sp.]